MNYPIALATVVFECAFGRYRLSLIIFCLSHTCLTVHPNKRFSQNTPYEHLTGSCVPNLIQLIRYCNIHNPIYTKLINNPKDIAIITILNLPVTVGT